MFIYVCVHILTYLSIPYSYIKYKLAFKVTDQGRSEVGLTYDCKLKNYQKIQSTTQPLQTTLPINLVTWHYFVLFIPINANHRQYFSSSL